jgi:hypothetical protein
MLLHQCCLWPATLCYYLFKSPAHRCKQLLEMVCRTKLLRKKQGIRSSKERLQKQLFNACKDDLTHVQL